MTYNQNLKCYSSNSLNYDLILLLLFFYTEIDIEGTGDQELRGDVPYSVR